MSGERLRYPFFPPPRWLLRDVADRRLSQVGFVVVSILYERASPSSLARRRETPTLTLDYLAERSAWTRKPESFQTYLRRLRDEERWFDYRTEGSPRRGVRYVFRLFPDDPDSASATRPRTAGDARPPVDAPEPEAGRGLALPLEDELVRVSEAADEADVSAKDGLVSANREAVSGLPERDSAPPQTEHVRVSRDVRREAKTLTEGSNLEVVGKGPGRESDKTAIEATERLVALIRGKPREGEGGGRFCARHRSHFCPCRAHWLYEGDAAAARVWDEAEEGRRNNLGIIRRGGGVET